MDQTRMLASAEDACLLSRDALADIAHELRAPLGGIEALVDLLGTTHLNAQQEPLVQALRQAARHLRSVASDLIDAPGAVAPSADRRGSVGAAIESFAVACKARAWARGVNFHLEVVEPCTQAEIADVRHLRQILENLADNALRFTRHGVVALGVLPFVDENGDAFVRFEMRDEGPGLTQDEAQAIFGRRVTLKNRSAGAGLGLSIVAGLVATLGGSCGAEARADRCGACLWFMLPVVGYCDENPALDRMPARHSGDQARQRVLVIDDHASSRQVLATILGHLDFDVASTGSPVRGLELAGGERFSAIFTDMTMPEFDGWTLVGHLRALPAPYGECPVVGVSGRVSGEDKTRFIASGGSGFIEKPLGIAALEQALRQLGIARAAICPRTFQDQGRAV